MHTKALIVSGSSFGLSRNLDDWHIGSARTPVGRYSLLRNAQRQTECSA